MPRKRMDLTGQKYGRLTAIRYIGYRSGKSIWEWQCDCGNKLEKSLGEVRGGGTVSCGCWRSEKVKANLIGQKFTNLTVIEEVGRDEWGSVIWRCKCDCGNTIDTLSKYLIQGDTTSCGCRRSKILAETTQKQIIHNMSNSKLYRTWCGMRERCNNPNEECYINYGGRGISVCKEWNDFNNFYEWAIINGYSEDLTIDRIDVNGNYEPQNCRWVNRKIQGNNTRRNHYLTYKGETKTMAEWAEIKGIRYSTLRGRINSYHWSVEKALETPVRNST